MRDICDDLEERAALVDEQIRGTYARFEDAVRRLQRERDERLDELKSDLASIEKVMELEQRRGGNSPEGHSPHKSSPEIISPLLSLADVFLRTLKERGTMSKHELVEFAVREGYFANPEQALQGVHPMVINMVRSEQIREVRKGVFAASESRGFGNLPKSDSSPPLTQVVKLKGAM
jgi:hypothetical protein